MGTALFDNQAVPATPAAGKSRVFVDSTTKRLAQLDDTGAVGKSTYISGNDSTASQVLPSGGETYITNSGLLIPSFGMKAGQLYRWYLYISKTAAGTGAAVFRLKQGANQTTADTTRATITSAAQTAAVDSGVFMFMCHVRSVSATGQVVFNYAIAGKRAADAVGFGNSSLSNIPATFDNTALAGTYVGLSIDTIVTGTPVWTIEVVECKLTG
jgi:hypothetical protein